MPPRPARRLSIPALLKVFLTNSLTAWDDELFDELFVERRYLGHPVFVISDPDGIKRVMLDNIDNYPRLAQVRRLFRRGVGVGLLSSEGETWRRHRRLMNPTLDSRSVMRDLAKTVELAEQAAAQLAVVPPGEPIHISPLVHNLLLESIWHVFAGADPDPEIGQAINRISHFPRRTALRDLFAPPTWLVAERTEPEDPRPYASFDRLIAKRRAPGYAGDRDLMWRLADAQDRRTGARLSDSEVRAEALTLANAAILTTLRSVTWFLYVLSLHPMAEARLHDELDRVLGGRSPGAADFAKLGFLDRAVDESMRLYPPIPVMMRRALAEDSVCGRRIPRGATICIVPWIVHRHRKLWDDPDRFDPDRFTAERVAARSRYAYLPFSTGPRVCVGESLAAMQTRAIVAILSQRFRFRPVPGHAVEPTGLITLRSRQGFKMTAEPRSLVTPPPSS